MTAQPGATTRFDRRKARTRSALVTAAQGFMAQGRWNVTVQDVTESADVGIGTFYNHFTSKDELFAAALEDALEQFATVLDALGDDESDPAAFFAQSFRLAGRLHRVSPDVSRVLLANAHELSTSERGLGQRARRDLAAGHAAGRFDVPDVDLAMVLVTGALVHLGHLLHDDADRDADEATDDVTRRLLLSLGLPRDEAADLASRPLPAALDDAALQSLIADLRPRP